MTDSRKEFGKKLIEIRENRGLRQADVAEIVNLSERSIGRLERGEIYNPSIDSLIELSKAYGVDIISLNKKYVYGDYYILEEINKSLSINAMFISKDVSLSLLNKINLTKNSRDLRARNIKLNSTNRTERNKIDISESFERLIDNSLNKDINNYTRDIVEAIAYGNASYSFCNDVIEGYSETFDTNSNRHHCISLIKEEIDFEKMNKINNKNNSICNRCWAKNLCRDCVTKYFLGTDNTVKNLNDCNHKRYYEYSMDTLMEIYDSSEERFYKIFENYPIFI